LSIQKIVRTLEGELHETEKSSSQNGMRFSRVLEKILRGGLETEKAEDKKYERSSYQHYQSQPANDFKVRDYLTERISKLRNARALLQSGLEVKISEGLKILEELQSKEYLDLDAALTEISWLKNYSEARKIADKIQEDMKRGSKVVYTCDVESATSAVEYFISESDYLRAYSLCSAILSVCPDRRIMELKLKTLIKSGLRKEVESAVSEALSKYPESSLAAEIAAIYRINKD